MKKNLRIVSAAAAALLAVAPVAATVVPAASTTVSAAAGDQQTSSKAHYAVKPVTAYTISNNKATKDDKTTDLFKNASYGTPVAVTPANGINNTTVGSTNYKEYSVNGTTFWLTEADAKNVVESEGSINDGTLNISLPAAKKGETLAQYTTAIKNSIAINQLPKLGDTAATSFTVKVLKNGVQVTTSNFKPEDASKYTVVVTPSYPVSGYAMGSATTHDI